MQANSFRTQIKSRLHVASCRPCALINSECGLVEKQESNQTSFAESSNHACRPVDPWQLIRQNTASSNFAQDESLFALANGTLGVRGGLEEDPSSSQGTFLSSVWERSPIEYHERFPGFARSTDTRIPIADATRIQLRLGESLVRLSEGTWLALERRLDMRSGCYRRSLRWRAPDGATLEIEAERIVALEQPGLLAMRYRVCSVNYTGTIALESAIDTSRNAIEQGADPRIGAHLNGGLRMNGTRADERVAWVQQQTEHSAIKLVCGQRHRPLNSRLSFRGAMDTPHGVMQVFAGTLAPGDEVALEKYVAYAWSMPDGGESTHDFPDLLANTEATLEHAFTVGFSDLKNLQTLALERFWRETDLAIDADPEIEQALRLNLFHLFQSSGRDGTSSTAAKGLTGEGYEGHYFWDAEAFMLPALVATAPELARSMLLYRYRTLEHARRHAREMNHPNGALYAWRTISGDECSAYFPSGSAQYHINAAIAWAIRLYVDASGDEAFMLSQGAEILFETARIWMAIGHFSTRRQGSFCIHEVTGPDEYSALVDNNHYTNRMAQRHLHDAAAVVNWMATQHPSEYAELATRIDLQMDEADQWQRAAQKMYLPTDPALDIFPQDDSFLEKPRLPTSLLIDSANSQALLLRLHPLTIYRHQVCKQADTLLSLMLAGEQVDTAAKQRNFDYYESVTVHDSTLSASTFAVMAAEVGYPDKAYRYFLDTLRVDLDDLHGNASHGVHMAAMAGSWLALTWGFGGLRIKNGQPALAPQLPSAWKSYRFGLRWRDAHLRVSVDGGGVLYTLSEGRTLTFQHDGQPQQLHAGQSLRLKHVTAASSSIRYPLPRRLKAVIFDLDGVIADTAVVHHAAWKQLAAELGMAFDDAVGERLKGVDRLASLEIVLEGSARHYSESEKQALAARKNDYYRQKIEHFGPQNLLPGAHAAIESARRAGLKVGLASASRNAALLLQRLGIAELFDHVVDAGKISRSKPDPEIFLAAANALGVAPGECIGVEDAAAGIASIRAAGMVAIGIGHAHALADADVVLPDVTALDLGAFTSP